ncbi:MAG: hypothetical protein Q9170_001929 [Blastenia crenularia]
MAFGWSISDIALLTSLAWKTVQNTRKACGEHDDLTNELSSLHTVLQRLEQEVSRPESLLNSPGDTSNEDVERIVSSCQKPLSLLDRVVEKYSLLSQEERNAKKLWLQVRFGNGEVANLRNIRDKLSSHTSALTLYLNLVSTGSIGRIEKQMEDAGGTLKDVKKAVNNLTARLIVGSHNEGSILTSRTNDDRVVWKEFRRGLLKEGFNSSFLHKHKTLIQAYLRELADRGVLDNVEPLDEFTLDHSPTSDAYSSSPKSALWIDGATSLSHTEFGPRQSVSIKSKTNSDGRPVTLRKSSEQEAATKSAACQRFEDSDIPSSLAFRDKSRPSKPFTVWSSGDPIEFLQRKYGDLAIVQRGSCELHQATSNRGLVPAHLHDILHIETNKGEQSTNLVKKRESPRADWWVYRWLYAGTHSSQREIRRWHERRRIDTSLISRRYRYRHCKSGIYFIASPWGLCIIFHGLDISTLLADFEYMVSVLQDARSRASYRTLDLRGKLPVKSLATLALVGCGRAEKVSVLIDLLCTTGAAKKKLVLKNNDEGTITYGWDDVGVACSAFLATDLTDPDYQFSESLGPMSIIRKVQAWIQACVDLGKFVQIEHYIIQFHLDKEANKS